MNCRYPCLTPPLKYLNFVRYLIFIALLFGKMNNRQRKYDWEAKEDEKHDSARLRTIKKKNYVEESGLLSAKREGDMLKRGFLKYWQNSMWHKMERKSFPISIEP